MSTADRAASTLIRSYELDGRRIDCYAVVYPDTPAGDVEYYDLFEDGCCINEGAPLFDPPHEEELRALLPAL
jgi:hypothetical protein